MMEQADPRPTVFTHVCIGGPLDGQCHDPGTRGTWFRHEGLTYLKRSIAGGDTLFAVWVAPGFNDDDGIIGSLLARYAGSA
jgi:hypothetical protein